MSTPHELSPAERLAVALGTSVPEPASRLEAGSEEGEVAAE